MERYVLNGITHPGQFELSPGLLSLGRNPTNDFRISDPTVSSFHCELEVSEGVVTVRDLNSTNGTYVDGEPVQERVLNPGQTLRLGEAELRLDWEEVAEKVEEAVVRIPELPKPVEAPTALPDGRRVCLFHTALAADYRCLHCQNVFCKDCVKALSLKGGEMHYFCPKCSGRCEALQAAAPAKKKSFLGRLTQTVRIRLR